MRPAPGRALLLAGGLALAATAGTTAHAATLAVRVPALQVVEVAYGASLAQLCPAPDVTCEPTAPGP